MCIYRDIVCFYILFLYIPSLLSTIAGGKYKSADLLAGEMSIEGTYDNAGVTYIESISDVNGLPFDNDAGSPLTQADQTGMQATFEAIAGSPLAGSTKPVITLPSA